jgi:hypothetical protein
MLGVVVTFVPMIVMGAVALAFVVVFALPMFVLVCFRTLGSSCHVVSLEEVYETRYCFILALYRGYQPYTTLVRTAFR